MCSPWNVKSKMSQMYQSLIEDTPPGASLPEDSPAHAYRRTTEFKIRKCIVLAFNIIQILFLLAFFLYFAFMDIEEFDHLKKAQVIMLVILPIFLAFQGIGTLGIIRENQFLTTIYFTVGLLFTILSFLNLLFPLLLAVEEDRLGSKLRDLLITTLESLLVGWFLVDLHKLRQLKKLATPAMRPMSML